MNEDRPVSVSRRLVLGASGGLALGTLTLFRRAHGIGGEPGRFAHDNQNEGIVRYPHVHDGKGEIDIKFFRFDGAAEPALMLTYSIPPGSSEGVHTHNLGDRKMGSFDEFYYIVEGEGEMQIDGEKVPVRAGDNVFTPNGVPHGIENTSEELLVVYLIAIHRA